jgi:hypothetical protein
MLQLALNLLSYTLTPLLPISSELSAFYSSQVSKIFDKFTRQGVNLLYHDVITQSLRLLKEKNMSKKINPDKQQKGVKRAAKNAKRKAKKSK